MGFGGLVWGRGFTPLHAMEPFVGGLPGPQDTDDVEETDFKGIMVCGRNI